MLTFIDAWQWDQIWSTPTVPQTTQAQPGGLYLLEATIDNWWTLSDDQLKEAVEDWVLAFEFETVPTVKAMLVFNDQPNPLASPLLYVVMQFPPGQGLVVLPFLWAIAVIAASIAFTVVGTSFIFSVSTTPDPWRRISATWLAALVDSPTIDEIAKGPIDPGLGSELLDLPPKVAWPFAIAAGAVALIFLTRSKA